VLAGAARALRGADSLDEDLRALLEAAAERIVLRDSPVSFAEGETSTAGAEIGATLDRFRSERRGGCCAARTAAASAAPPFPLSAAALSRVVLEDQAGIRLGLIDRLRGRTCLVAFFYTRCMNPAKCSLTITRLAALARAGDRPDILAISYDGPFDDPARLRGYGRDRGFPFGDRAQLLRCRTGWPAVRSAFGLRVGYGGATVNEHAREAFLVGPDLKAAGLDAEALADPAAVTRRANELGADGR
jgi:protein SCO1/2